MGNIEEMKDQLTQKMEKITMVEIEQEKNEQFTEKVGEAFTKVIEAYKKLSPKEKEAVKAFLKNR